MIILRSEDILEVKLKSLIADYDRDTLVTLYQPLIGYQALALYLSLWSEATNQKVTSLSNHEQLFVRMQISSGDFLKARKALEAIGLLKTYKSDNNGVTFYRYEVFAPKTPCEFFDDTILYGLLIKYLGEMDANRLKGIYINRNEDNEGENITASFGEVFHPDFDDSSYMKALNGNKSNVASRKKSKIEGDFSYEKFFEEIKKISQLNEKSFTKVELKNISRMATLYGVNEETVSYHVANLYDVHKNKGERIDIHDLANEFMKEVSFAFLNKKRNKKSNGTISNDSDLANKVNLFEKVTPKQFLSIMQNGTVPANTDLWLIYDLAEKFRLSNSVINVIVDYVITINNNVLSRSLCEKIAACLAREGVNTAIDAMNYINSNIITNKKSSGSKKEKNSEKEDSQLSLTKEEVDEKWDSLLKDIENK